MKAKRMTSGWSQVDLNGTRKIEKVAQSKKTLNTFSNVLKTVKTKNEEDLRKEGVDAFKEQEQKNLELIAALEAKKLKSNKKTKEAKNARAKIKAQAERSQARNQVKTI